MIGGLITLTLLTLVVLPPLGRWFDDTPRPCDPGGPPVARLLLTKEMTNEGNPRHHPPAEAARLREVLRAMPGFPG